MLHFLRTSLCGAGGRACALLASGLLLSATAAHAQVDTYQFAASTGTYTALPTTATPAPVNTSQGTATTFSADDAVTPPLPLGFTFVFDGVSYTQVVASSNGFVSFNPSATYNSYTNNLGTTANATEKPMVAPFWDDLTGANGGAARYQTAGTAPNRVFTFEWSNWTTLSSSGAFSMQAKLYEGTNVVQFVYGPGRATTASASIGMAGGVRAGVAPSFLALNNSGATPTPNTTADPASLSPSPASGQVYTFTPAPPSACATPRNLTATTTTTTAVLSWSVNGGSGPFTVQYGLPGFDPTQPSSGTNAYQTLTGVTGTSTTVSGLAPGTTYQFYVTQVCGGTAGSSARSNAGTFSTQITNDNPCTATPLPINNTCTPLSTTNVNATASTGSGLSTTSCSGFNFNPLDVWFSVTTAATGPTSTAVRVTVTGGAASQVQGYAASTCNGPFTPLLCVGSASNVAAGNLDLTNLTPSTTYYVRVFSYFSADAAGPFTICAVPVPNCPVPVGLTVGAVTPTSAQLAWGGTTSAGSTYQIVYGAPNFDPNTGGTTISNITGQNTTLVGLASSANYCFYVRQVCGGFNGSSALAGPVCFSTPVAPAANDEPCGAVALSNNVVANGTNVGATTTTQSSIQLPACTPAQLPKDVWFVLTPASGNTSVTVTLTGAAAGMARLYTAPSCAAGPFTQVGCQAAAGANTGFTAPVTFSGLTAGTRYYLAVSGYGSSDTPGAFTLRATPLGSLATRVQAEAASLTVAPNPSNTGQLTVRLHALGTAASAATAVRLYNALGQAVLAQPARLNAAGALEQALDVHNLATGVYTLRVQVGEQVLTRKVVLE